METKQCNLSILMFPWLAHGHVFPYLELAKNLSKKNIKIFFCSTPINLSSVDESQLENSSIQKVELHLPLFPDLPPQYHTTKNVPPHLFPRLCQAFHKSKSNFSEILSTIKPDLLIYDLVQTWAPRLASSLGIPAVHFSTTGATAYSFLYHYFTKKDCLDFPYPEIYLRPHERKALDGMAISDIIDENDKDLGPFPFMKLSCELVLMKSCKGIEGKYIDYMSLLIQRKVVPVGSLVIQADDVDDADNSDTMEWLSKRNNSSTVFICFGSENHLPKDQMGEIAKGLELCDVNFIWVVKLPPGETCIHEVLPKGFVDKVKDRGLIVEGWAPQSKILAHPSIGAFVSHCGMSSTLESIYFGVPIVAIPFKFDQPLNARLLTEVGISLEISADENNGEFRGEELANAINDVIFGKTREEMRLKAAELSKKMKNEDETTINEAAENLRRLCMEYKKQHA